MKRMLATLFLAATISATFGVISLNAQTDAVANVPFAFHVQSKTMPAGKYSVGRLTESNRGLMNVSDRSGHSSLVSASPAGDANPDEPKLTFSCYRGDCTLRGIDLPGSSVSFAVPQPNGPYKVGMAAMVRIRLTH